MVRTKDGDGIKSNLIITEVQKRPCLFDTNHPNYGDRAEKSRCWEEVCQCIVPGWAALGPAERFAAAKEVQKRWRSIRDSFTKAYRQGKCVMPEQCTPGSRRYQYHRQMEFLLRALQNKCPNDQQKKAYRQGKCLIPEQCTPGSRRYQYHRQMEFLLRALQNKKPRYSQDRYESFSELSNSPQHPPPDDIRIKTEPLDKPLDLKTKPDVPEKPETVEKSSQTGIDNGNINPSLEIKIDANSILPDDHFDDDRSFMNSLIPLFKKMDDDTRLLCRIEVLKIIRYALQGNKCFEALKIAEDSFFKNRISGILNKDGEHTAKTESRLSMTTRSADGSRPIRKRKHRSPSPIPTPPKRRGPGRPRKVRPPPSDSEDDPPRRRSPKTKQASPAVPACLPDPPVSEMDEGLNRATSVAQLSTPLFMKMYNLGRSKDAPLLASAPNMQVSVKTEPADEHPN